MITTRRKAIERLRLMIFWQHLMMMTMMRSMMIHSYISQLITVMQMWLNRKTLEAPDIESAEIHDEAVKSCSKGRR